MQVTEVSPPDFLAALRWVRVRGAVRNTRDAAAREHPLWILHGLLMFAVPEASPEGKVRFTFRPLADVGGGISRDQIYPFEIIFPGDDLSVAETFLNRLTRHVEDPSNNFALAQLEPPQVRSLADLECGALPWPPGLTEICLEFRTPLAYTPVDDRRPWMLNSVQLGQMFAHRIQHLFAQPCPAPADLWQRLSTLCHYWEFVELPHRAKSGDGVKTIAGNQGPLYLRGAPENLAAVRPWLLLGSELGAGLKLGSRGHFDLRFDRPALDPLFAQPATYLGALEELRRRSDLPDDFGKQLGRADEAAAKLAASVGSGQWQPAPAMGFRVDKSTGAGQRLLVQLPARDRLVHQALQIALTPLFDRLFEAQSHGFRPGRGVASVRRFVQEAWNRGYTVALETDIEAFFDSVDWDALETQLDAFIPRADHHTRATLHALLRTPVRLNRREIRRTRGLLQGSPLSPLLANVHLDPFDEEMTRRGYCLVRYADDFIVLCRSEDEAKRALDAAREILGGLKLTLKESKTAIQLFATGFTFLGERFGGGIEQELVEDTALDKTLFIRHPHCWVGVDHDTVTVRDEGRMIARLPLRRVREIVLLGAGGVSAKLIERCAQRDIAISFCTSAGRLQNIVWRHDRANYEMAAAHSRRHAAQVAPERIACARAIVAAKLSNYLAWFRERPDAELRPAIETLETGLKLLSDATTLDELRGVEGMAARDVFRALNRRAPEAFRSQARVPGEQPDAWNLLLDFTYSLLFQRINMLLRLRGLDPYLGFLHSPQARYESLVCDLQEPFRARCDRFVLKLVNRGQITAADFTADPLTGIDLAPKAGGRFLSLYAQELDTKLAGDLAAWARLIEAQVLAMERWAKDGEVFRVYFASPAAAPPPPVLP
ncbi:MAG: CRISPR-associated endonuclease Cas1, partial [Verrucomicrobia bacterium]|nr:CRISPR-associated endonuclease Cas1 [Verrucomicrobiota bacterium]